MGITAGEKDMSTQHSDQHVEGLNTCSPAPFPYVVLTRESSRPVRLPLLQSYILVTWWLFNVLYS